MNDEQGSARTGLLRRLVRDRDPAEALLVDLGQVGLNLVAVHVDDKTLTHVRTGEEARAAGS